MKICRLTSRTEPAYDALLRIYIDAHPASELKSSDVLAHMIARPEYLFLAAIEAGAVIGFAIAIAFPDSDAALLEYMAVDAAHRGRGLGQRLFRAVAGHEQMRNRVLLVEVDSDRVASADPVARARRKRFYRRLGCRQVDGLEYVMPRVSSADPPVMDVLACGCELPETIKKERLRGWLEACYAQVYQQPLPDERIEAMLATLPNPIQLV